jgi:hypothetical protein
MIRHHCLSCAAVTPHLHLHDCAHGIPETHMAGSERFQCVPCGRITLAHSPDADTFSFVLDGQAMRRIVA